MVFISSDLFECIPWALLGKLPVLPQEIVVFSRNTGCSCIKIVKLWVHNKLPLFSWNVLVSFQKLFLSSSWGGRGYHVSHCRSSTTTPSQTGLFDNAKLHKGMKIAHLNICGLECKLDDLKLAMDGIPIDVLTLSETHLTESVTDQDFIL